MPAAVGMSVDDVEDMYRLLAIAKYDGPLRDPAGPRRARRALMEQQGACGLDFEGGPGNCGATGAPRAPRRPVRPSSRPVADARARAGGARRRRAADRLRGRLMRVRQRAAAGGVMIPFALISIALRYPDEELMGSRADVAGAADALPASPARDALRSFLAWWVGEPADALRRTYVETFDFSRRTALDLTYYTHGDRRQRGLALLDLRRRYDGAGLDAGGPRAARPPSGRAGVRRPRPRGRRRDPRRLPARDRADQALAGARREPLCRPSRCVCLALPDLRGDEAAELRRLALEGPPGETVGLEPFAPPEVMPDPVRPARPSAPRR